MQLKQIARDALLKPLQAVSGIVERRHTLPILANVLLEQKDGSLHVTATDLEMQITARSEMPVKDGQAVTVAARKLQDLLRALPDDTTVNVDAAGNKMTVKAGRSRFNLQTLAATDYPRIGVSSEHLQTLTRQAQHAPLVDRLSALQNILSETPGIRLRALSWDAAGNRLQLDIAAVSSRALEQFTQRAQPRFRVRPGDMITKPDGIEGQLTLEENDG